VRYAGADRAAVHHDDQHAGLPAYSELPVIDPHSVYNRIIRESTLRFEREVWLWKHDQGSLTGTSGELDAAVQMPGWANVWTRPIQNRIDMLSTGVSSEVGVRVLGDDFSTVVTTSERIAEALQHIPGAADVIADPIRGKDYVDIDLRDERLVELHLTRAEVELSVQAVTSGYLIPSITNASASSGLPSSSVPQLSIPVRLRIQLPANRQADSLLDTPLALEVSPRGGVENRVESHVELIAFRDLAQIRHRDGPATIKSYNGQLCNYVRLNVRGRDASQWVQEAKSVLRTMALPSGISLQWTGQFEHAARTRESLLWMVPLCLAIIGFLLLFTFRDLADALLMLLSIPGALAGAIMTQWILGYPFSLAVGVGYLACFGMAAATSIVMIIYLRQSLEDAGGLEQVSSLEQLRSCVIAGAVHRLRPKLLTEATMIFSLTPLLWSTGVGADVIRPMAAPVLGGILVADEVVDLLLPAMFFAVRRRRWLRQRPQ
jgi:Cu(I)/Ag(I) efflux system membrane protein CusA/SilA